MKLNIFIFAFALLGIFACQSGKHRDSYAQAGSNKKGLKSHKDSFTSAPRRGRSLQFYDSYSSSSRKRKGMGFRDSYSSSNSRNSSNEGSDSYSTTSSKKKRSFKFWKNWKKDARNRTAKSYNESRRRKVFLKRKPPQGIKAS